jgi:hypothetical protein
MIGPHPRLTQGKPLNLSRTCKRFASRAVRALQWCGLDGGGGGILTQSLSLSYHLFSNLHETSMNIGDFYGLACFNCLSYFTRLGQISGLNRHQRHQDNPLDLPDLVSTTEMVELGACWPVYPAEHRISRMSSQVSGSSSTTRTGATKLSLFV